MCSADRTRRALEREGIQVTDCATEGDLRMMRVDEYLAGLFVQETMGIARLTCLC